jgi:hypothetical protein
MRLDSMLRTVLQIVFPRVQALSGAALFFLTAWITTAVAQVSMTPVTAMVLHTQGSVLSLEVAGVPQSTLQVTLPGPITASAVSGPGQAPVIAVATAHPFALHLFDRQLKPLQTLRLLDRAAKRESSVCAIHVAQQRQSFVLVFSAMPELWEVSYNPTAPEIGLGMVHDFQYREGHFVPGYLNPLRTSLAFVPTQSAFGADGHSVELRDQRAGGMSEPTIEAVIHLDVRKPIAASTDPRGPWLTCIGP